MTTRLKVELSPPADRMPLAGCAVDRPVDSSSASDRSLSLAGWVIGAEKRAIAVEVASGGQVLRRVRCESARPDVAAAFPDRDALRSGFEDVVRFLDFPAAGIEIRAVLEDQARVPMAIIRREADSGERTEQGGPLVSIVIPCFKQASFLEDSIGSVLRQSHPRLELIVVDDGSPDNTEEVVRRMPGVGYVRQDNLGLAAARNTGLSRVRGDFVLFLDADDRLAPGAIEKSLAYFRQNSEYGLVAGHFRHVGLDGEELVVPERRTSPGDLYAALLRDYLIGPPGAILFRRAVFERVGPFDTSISPAADYDMSLRVAREFPVQTHPEIVLDYRRHGASMSGNPGVMLSTTVRALRKQRLHARKDPETHRAYREGFAHWRRTWGEALVEKVKSDWSGRRWGRVAREAWTLLIYHPLGLIELGRRGKHASKVFEASDANPA
jgi:glycosyltransferase involved in cell wall biosynthesis